MPAHIYIRTGRYHDATLSNLAASSADAAFLAVCRGSNGVYPLGYVPHNWHFAAMTAGLHGSRTLAMEAAEQTAKRADPDQLQTLSFMQQFVVAPLYTQVRFGQWDTILAQAAPPADLPYPRGVWQFARGMAHVRQGKLADAARELTALESTAADPTLQKLVLWDINRADHVLGVAKEMLRGELALARGKRDTGIAALRAAIAAEDKLNYNEPPDWPLPVRPYLGAVLLEAGRPKEAAEVYVQDLAKYRENGWSLYGLARAQRALKQESAAIDSERRLATAWQWADTQLTASRF
jgi:tetratricopeptide (TPR) repeat protein